MQILGRAPAGFRIVKVKGHADPDSAATSHERYLAMGNDHADRVARAAAADQPQPSPLELQEYDAQISFLRQYLPYVSQALALWPAVGPSLGKRPLPRTRESAARRGSRGGQASFLHDVLSAIGPQRAPTVSASASAAAPASSAPPGPPDLTFGLESEPPQDVGTTAAQHQQAETERAQPPGAEDHQAPKSASGAPQRGPMTTGARQDCATTATEPTASSHSQIQDLDSVSPHPEPQSSAPAKEDAPAEGHDWVKLESRWTCRSCLSTSRALFPPKAISQGWPQALRISCEIREGILCRLPPSPIGVGWSSYAANAATSRPANVGTQSCTPTFVREALIQTAPCSPTSVFAAGSTPHIARERHRF